MCVCVESVLSAVFAYSVVTALGLRVLSSPPPDRAHRKFVRTYPSRRREEASVNHATTRLD